MDSKLISFCLFLFLLSLKDCEGIRFSQTWRREQHPVDFFNINPGRNAPPGVKLQLYHDKVAYRNFRLRPGQSSETHRCNTISPVPSSLTFLNRGYYRKYTHAYGIPIISSRYVSDAALKRACYVVRFLLADRRVIRRYLYRYFGRVGVIGVREGTTSIPEHRHLGSWWNQRARGLGGTLHIPISTGGEENILCHSNDRYRNEDIFLHEFSHSFTEIAIKGGAIRGYMARLTAAYNNAKRTGLWRRTYAMSTVQEYFAEGTQSYFDCNAESRYPNGIHNHVNTRAELRTYDPRLFRLVKEIFPCGNIYHKRCRRGTPGPFRMNCDGDGPTRPQTPPPRPPPRPRPETDPPQPPPLPTTEPPSPPLPKTQPPTEAPTTVPPKKLHCKDKSSKCKAWASVNYCFNDSYKAYMLRNCQESCSCCKNTSPTCSNLAYRGYCHWRKDYMHRFCAKSCGVCDAYN